MSVALFCEVLANFGADRARALDGQIRGGIECVYVLVWPDYQALTENHPQANRAALARWRKQAAVETWAWLNVPSDQHQAARAIAELDRTLAPSGWLLDIEGEWVEGASLETVLAAARSTGKPIRVSLAGTSASHVAYDFRAIDRAGATIDWQCYFDSREGPLPAVGVAELWRASFVVEGWEYRHRLSDRYGWCRIVRSEYARAIIDSYVRPGAEDASLAIRSREWGWWVHDRRLYRDGLQVGYLLGRARASRIRATLDVTRGAARSHTLAEWTEIARSARIPGVRRCPVSVYLAEVCPDDVLAAIAEGAP